VLGLVLTTGSRVDRDTSDVRKVPGLGRRDSEDVVNDGTEAKAAKYSSTDEPRCIMTWVAECSLHRLMHIRYCQRLGDCDVDIQTTS